MDPDDKAVLAYLAGVVTVAVVLPGLFVLAVRHVPPIRRAFRRSVVEKVDAIVVRQKDRQSAIVRGTIDGALLTVAAATDRPSPGAVINELVSQPAADAVLSELGAPTGP